MNIEGEGIKQEAPKAELLPERWSKPAESREVQEALHQLFEQTLDLARQLQPELTNGEYRLIVGDDASGRLATLVMRDVANALQPQDMPQPLVRFIAGSTGLSSFEEEKKQYLVDDQIERIKEDMVRNDGNVGKALIVTDSIATGSSISVLINALKKAGVPADVATQSVISSRGRVVAQATANVLSREWGGRVVFAGTDTPKLYMMRTGLGINKEPEELFADRAHDKDDAEAWSQVSAVRQMTGDVAKDVVDALLRARKSSEQAA